MDLFIFFPSFFVFGQVTQPVIKPWTFTLLFSAPAWTLISRIVSHFTACQCTSCRVFSTFFKACFLWFWNECLKVSVTEAFFLFFWSTEPQKSNCFPRLNSWLVSNSFRTRACTTEFKREFNKHMLSPSSAPGPRLGPGLTKTNKTFSLFMRSDSLLQKGDFAISLINAPEVWTKYNVIITEEEANDSRD